MALKTRTFVSFRNTERSEFHESETDYRLILVITGVILGVAKALGGEGQSGDWTMRRSDAPGRVEFSLMNSRRASFSLQFDWPASDFSGLDFPSRATRSSFYDRADAGKFDARDFWQDGEGAGCFISPAEPRYSQEMNRSVSKGSTRQTMAMAIHDVSLKFARDIKAETCRDWIRTSSIAFKIHGVTPEFIRSIRSQRV